MSINLFKAHLDMVISSKLLPLQKICCDILEFPLSGKTLKHRIALNSGISYRIVRSALIRIILL